MYCVYKYINMYKYIQYVIYTYIYICELFYYTIWVRGFLFFVNELVLEYLFSIFW